MAISVASLSRLQFALTAMLHYLSSPLSIGLGRFMMCAETFFLESGFLAVAAFEGHFRTEHEGTALYLFGIPNTAHQRVKYGIAIPGLLSWLVHGDKEKPVSALDAFKPEDHPLVSIPFFSYHLMEALGLGCVVPTIVAAYLRWRGAFFEHKWLVGVFIVTVVGPFLANQADWVEA